MKREDRYLVLKYSDIDKYLNRDDMVTLARICSDIDSAREEDGKDRTNYVCVAHDWPMYEDTWTAIAEWVDSQQEGL